MRMQDPATDCGDGAWRSARHGRRAAKVRGVPRALSIAGRRGAARGALLLLGVALALVALLVWRSGDGGEPRGAAARSAEPAAVPGERAASQGAGADDARGAPRAGGAGGAGAPVRAQRASRGSLRGALGLPEGAELDGAFQVIARRVGPVGDGSDVVEGLARGEAPFEARAIVPAGQREFALTDLPLGRYELLVEAEGLSSLPHPVELSPESAAAYAVLRAWPSGALSGRILHEDGTPVEGARLRLASRTGAGEALAVTDATGAFRFERVQDGEYVLHYGEPGRALFEPRTLSFRAPGMHLPTEYAPDRGSVVLRVLDEAGNPVEGVVLTGSGERGGAIDAATDERGEVRLTGLPSGEYRVWTSREGFARALEIFPIVSGSNPDVFFTLHAQ